MSSRKVVDDIRSLLQRPRAAIMGIINITPDSFSDGGQFDSAEAAFRHAMTLVDEGADILDIGGESTRPGADSVSLQQEQDRVLPVIELIRAESDIPISIDTYKPQMMQAAVASGASMINDVNGLQADRALETAAATAVPVCVMHKQGRPKDMQVKPGYDNVVREVLAFFEARVRACEAAGIERNDLFLDPGIGFGKTLNHNLLLLQSLAQVRSQLKCELLIGVSRKSMIDHLFGRSVQERLPASLGLVVQAVLNGAKIVRVHDVRATHDAVRSAEAVLNARPDNN